MTTMICARHRTCEHTRADNPGCYCCAGEPHERTAACGPRMCPNDKQPCECLEVQDGPEN